MKSYTKQNFGQEPTEFNHAVAPSAFPEHSDHPDFQKDLGDDGLIGQHRNDKVTLHNAHPHQEHSKGHDAHHPTHLNHGFAGFHIAHGRRDKGSEHHPPKGLMEHNAVQHRGDMAKETGVFGGNGINAST
jgi:hypothetical protein